MHMCMYIYTYTGALNLVDLAGSERLDRSKVEGIRQKEACAINKSLSSLGTYVWLSLLPSSLLPSHTTVCTEHLGTLLQISISHA